MHTYAHNQYINIGMKRRVQAFQFDEAWKWKINQTVLIMSKYQRSVIEGYSIRW